MRFYWCIYSIASPFLPLSVIEGMFCGEIIFHAGIDREAATRIRSSQYVLHENWDDNFYSDTVFNFSSIGWNVWQITLAFIVMAPHNLCRNIDDNIKHHPELDRIIIYDFFWSLHLLLNDCRAVKSRLANSKIVFGNFWWSSTGGVKQSWVLVSTPSDSHASLRQSFCCSQFGVLQILLDWWHIQTVSHLSAPYLNQLLS